MVVDFIKARRNLDSLQLAKRQEEQLSYYTQSKIQEQSLSLEYMNAWAGRQYETNDIMLNFVKHIFKTENFLKFFQYYRNPVPSSKLIQNKIKPNLKRVFHAEDSYEKYTVDGVEREDFIHDLHVKSFNEMIFNGLLFNHNSILITDLKGTNDPFRRLINVKDIVSLEYDGEEDKIYRIAFKAMVNNTPGYLYIDDKVYQFVDSEYKLYPEIPHDLGHCPAHFIVKHTFSDDEIVKWFILSNIREEMEEYVFLKTLQKMTEPNGVIPVTVMLDTEIEGEQDSSVKTGEPRIEDAMGSQSAGMKGGVLGGKPGSGILQTGTVFKVPQIRADNGLLDMAAVQEYLKFVYIPVEAMKYIDQRIRDIHDRIISTILGDLVVSTEFAKNEDQIAKSISVLEDNLRTLSDALSRIRTLADIDYLGLRYGIENVKVVNIFYGSEFFLENESTLFDLFEKAPNPIERKQTLIRINHNRYKNNHETAKRYEILYNIIPFSSDKDFETAKDKVSDVTFYMQIMFNYWIAKFEAEYGDILEFYENQGNASDSQKYLLINNLITNLIKSDESYKNKSLQRTETPVQ